MGRNIDSKKIGVIINALKEKDLYTRDLVALGISKRTVIRILEDYLQKWGLVEKNHKRGERWVWFERSKKQPWKGTPLLLNIAKDHTHDLLPGLTALLDDDSENFLKERNEIFEKPIPPIPFDDDYEVIRRNQLFLSKFAEQHLKTGYPQIYDVLIDFRQLNREIANKTEEAKKRANIEFMKKFGAFKKKPDDVELLEGNQKKNVRELIKERPEWGRSWGKDTGGLPYVLGPFHTQKELQEIFKHLNLTFPTPIISTKYHPPYISRIIHYVSGKENGTIAHYFVPGPVEAKISKEDEEKLNEQRILVKEKYGELAKQISVLKLQAKNQPLDGQCDICPNIVIKEQASLLDPSLGK